MDSLSLFIPQPKNTDIVCSRVTSIWSWTALRGWEAGSPSFRSSTLHRKSHIINRKYQGNHNFSRNWTLKDIKVQCCLNLNSKQRRMSREIFKSLKIHVEADPISIIIYPRILDPIYIMTYSVMRIRIRIYLGPWIRIQRYKINGKFNIFLL